jgi:hypothetical protein
MNYSNRSALKAELCKDEKYSSLYASKNKI